MGTILILVAGGYDVEVIVAVWWRFRITTIPNANIISAQLSTNTKYFECPNLYCYRTAELVFIEISSPAAGSVTTPY